MIHRIQTVALAAAFACLSASTVSATDARADVPVGVPVASEPGEGTAASFGDCGPGNGDCCAANGTPGCNDAACCDKVCSLDDFCCAVEWNQDCAGFALSFCDPAACGGGDDPCVGAGGDCCADNGTPGCNNLSCCEAVCAFDAFCCETSWDGQCANEAADACFTLCSGIPECPSDGDCCTNHGGTGCDDSFCCDQVCSNTPSCCEAVWSQTCVDLAVILCDDLCEPPPPPNCPGAGDCCSGNGTVGCDNITCCETVCADDSFCCETEWDDICADDATILCPTLCGACPDDDVFACLEPVSPYLDARQPHPVDDASLRQGVSTFRVMAPENAQFIECWELCETTQNLPLHPGVGPNTIVGVVMSAPMTYDITLAQSLTPGEITTITYRSASGLTVETCTYVYLPADVNGDGTSAPADILGVIDCLNGVAGFDCSIANTDTDRGNEAGPSDILRVIDLLNGANQYEVWLDASVVETGECP